MTFLRDNIFLICVVLYCIGALAWPYIRKSAKISNSEATKMINRGKTAVLDIRDNKLYQAGHIVNAVHVPMTSFQERIQRLEKFKENPVILVDEDGKGTAEAVELLRKEGFSAINTLKGGMAGWREEGLPTTR